MSDENEENMPDKRSKKGIVIGAVVVACLVTSGVLFYLHSRNYVATDDAYTTGTIHQISARMPATVTAVEVVDNQVVKKGDLLVSLDPREFEIAVQTACATGARARASESQARAAIELAAANRLTAEAKVKEIEAQGAQIEAQLNLARTDYNRDIALSKSSAGAISQREIDAAEAKQKEAEAAAVAAQATLDATRTQVRAAAAGESAAKADLEASAASVASADAEIALAELNLGFTKITAPADGKVSKKSVETGQRLSPGQPLMAIVPQDVWVVANLKETQLARLKIGQTVEIDVDAIPDKTFRGKVESVQEGSGSTFSLLPSDNSIGNFTKIVQRVPVKIVFDSNEVGPYRDRLVPGLSVEPKIDLRSVN